MLSLLAVFVFTYALFSVSGFLFPFDPVYYASLKKPPWTPPAKLFGIVWNMLYALIALSVTLVYAVTDGFRDVSAAYLTVLLVNYAANQAFSYFQFTRKSLRLAFRDCFLVAFTTFLLINVTLPYSALAAWLLIPYLLWTCFATYLSWTLYRLNKPFIA